MVFPGTSPKLHRRVAASPMGNSRPACSTAPPRHRHRHRLHRNLPILESRHAANSNVQEIAFWSRDSGAPENGAGCSGMNWMDLPPLVASDEATDAGVASKRRGHGDPVDGLEVYADRFRCESRVPVGSGLASESPVDGPIEPVVGNVLEAAGGYPERDVDARDSRETSTQRQDDLWPGVPGGHAGVN